MSDKPTEAVINDLETAYNRMLCEMHTNRYELRKAILAELRKGIGKTFKMTRYNDKYLYGENSSVYMFLKNVKFNTTTRELNFIGTVITTNFSNGVLDDNVFFYKDKYVHVTDYSQYNTSLSDYGFVECSDDLSELFEHSVDEMRKKLEKIHNNT